MKKKIERSTYIPPKHYAEQRITMIETELARLGVPYLLPLVQRIIRNFINFPFDPEMEPSYQLLARLRQLPTPVARHQIHQLVATLDAFSYRAFVRFSDNPYPVYWNPLEQAFDDFYPIHDKVTVQAEHEYPASDIILHHCDMLEPR